MKALSLEQKLAVLSVLIVIILSGIAGGWDLSELPDLRELLESIKA